MHWSPTRRLAALVFLVAIGVVTYECTAAAGQGATPTDTAPQQNSGSAFKEPSEGSSLQSAPGGNPHIRDLLIAPSGTPASQHLALNDKLAIELDRVPAHPAGQYVLFLNDTEVPGLGPANYVTLENGRRALVFKLVRNSDNSAFWKELLGSPKHFMIPLTVALGERPEPCLSAQPCKTPEITIRGVNPDKPAAVEFNLISWAWLGIACLAVVAVTAMVWGHARISTTLRDNLVPQLPANQQPYSLARWQMAFWFVLIFASFIFLYVLLWDYNTISPQALALMGISGATALAAVEIDVIKDSPADATNRALRALGLNTYDDVLRLEKEIEARRPQVVAAQSDFNAKTTAATEARRAAEAFPEDESLESVADAAAAVAALAEKYLQQLQAEIQDRRNTLRTYEDKTRPFATQGWLKDLTTDLNGPTVHRIQVLCWTAALGAVFIIGVYRDLSMPPDFSPTLLALMGISSAGYVGFKYPEKNI
ncbi:MAG TPA: hypothetical protein VI653_10955 [Steroidobacteraceae bacterium]